MTHKCMHAYMFSWVHMHAWMHICVFVCTHAWMLKHGHIYACANILMYACPCMYAFPHMHVHMHACIHACTHACADVPMCDFASMTTPGNGVISAEFLVVTTSTTLRMNCINAVAHDSESSESE